MGGRGGEGEAMGRGEGEAMGGGGREAMGGERRGRRGRRGEERPWGGVCVIMWIAVLLNN